MSTVTELLSTLRQQDVKLWLDGDKLRYRAAKNTLSPELLAQLKIRKVEIIDFLKSIGAGTSSPMPPLQPVDRTGNLPLSFGQQRLWFLYQFEPHSSANNVPVVVRFTGDLNVPALEQSLQHVLSRHEVLRTTFPVVNGQPIQSIDPDVTLTLPIFDLQHLPATQREAEALRLATAEAHQPFDLTNGPTVRVMLLRLTDREHLLLWNMNSIVCDGASSDLFYQETIASYQAFARGETPQLPVLPIQYADFAQWQRQWLQGEVLASQVNYWRQKLAGNLPTIKLPFDRSRPVGVPTYRGDRAARMLPKALETALTKLSQNSGGTLFMTLLTAFNVLLYRYSQQEDLLISFASTGRGQAELEKSIGFFSNTLLLRTNLAGNPSFRELVDRVRQECVGAYRHQDLPFEKLVEELRPEQRQDRSPLFQVKFALNPPWSKGRGMAAVKLPDLTITSLFGYIYHGQTKYDLILVMREQDEGLGMVFDYNADMFDAGTIDRLLGHFHTLLEGIVANPDQPIAELPIFDPTETPLVAWDGTATTDPAAEHEFIAPRNQLELELTKIWQQVLGIESIGIRDNFFELGGHSLIAVRLFAEIERIWSRNLPLATLFQAQTIEALANLLSQTDDNPTWSSLVPIQPQGAQPPLFCFHPIGGNILEYYPLVDYLGKDRPIYGLQSQGLDGSQQLLSSVEAMASHYLKDILAIQPQAPYLLVGYSFGGFLAFEVAQQLQAMGKQVDFLALLDRHSPTIKKMRPSFAKSVQIHLHNLWQLNTQEKMQYIKDRIDYRFNNVDYREFLIRSFPESAPPSVELLKLIDTNFAANRSYVAQPYAGNLTLFRCQRQTLDYALSMDLGWSDLVSGNLEIYHVAGSHYDILREPNVQFVAETIKSCLEKVPASISAVSQT
jgi:thioesterase domain-containing protein/acyl carrier protein